MDNSHSERLDNQFSDMSIDELKELIKNFDPNDDLQAKIYLDIKQEIKNRG